MLRRGFTVVEIIITLTIMGILLALAVVNLNATQISSRDDERKADVKAISDALETYFTAGTDNSTALQQYPETTALSTSSVSTETQLRAAFRDVTIESFIAPGAANLGASFMIATNATQTTSGVTPQPTISQYVYQPLAANATLCTAVAVECRKYNLYYRLESDSTVYKVMSKNQ